MASYAAPAEPAADAPEANPKAPGAKAAAVKPPSLQQRIQWFDDWEELTRENRKLARTDREYYDGKQWSQEDLAQLKARGQPPIVKNRIARKINFVLGEEIKKRVDPVARPRTPQHEDAARAATDALRYVEEEQNFDRVRSAVLKNILIEGYGGALKELDETRGYAHGLVHVEWDRLFYDPHSRCADFSDAKYKGIVRWADLEDAIADYPESEETLRATVTRDIGSSDDTTEDVPRRWGDKRRSRVKIVEMYFRVGADWYRADFTQAGDLRDPERCVYLDEKGQHSICPLIMASCYVDQRGMRYGVVRQLISPQDEINKRSSKALHLLSVRQVLAERDMVRDPQKLRTELAKPDGYIEVEPAALERNSVQILQTADLAAGQVQLLQEAKADIDTIGPSSATIPDLPDSSSGRAFLARQQAASQELGPVFDTLLDWTLSVYELDWCCVRQFWTEEKWLRVTDDEELTGYRFVALNRQMTRAERIQELLAKQVPLEKALGTAAGNEAPWVLMRAKMAAQQAAQMQQQRAQMMAQRAQALGMQPPPAPQEDPAAALQQFILQDPAMQQVITENQVDQMLVDIVVDVAPETAILAQEEFQTLTDLLPTIVQTRPDMAPTMAKLVVKASQLPNKRELLQELDKGPDPQAMQMQQVMQQLQAAKAKADVDVAGSQAALNQARAVSEQAKTEQSGAKLPSEIEKNKAQAMRDAVSAGASAGAGGGRGAGAGGPI